MHPTPKQTLIVHLPDSPQAPLPIVPQGLEVVLLDLHGRDLLGSAHLSWILRLSLALGSGRLVVVGASPRVLATVQMLGLDRLLRFAA